MEKWIVQLYKSQSGFAKNTLENRRSTAVERRRDYRNDVLTQFRQIPQVMSPLHLNKNVEIPQEAPQKSNRLEMLEKWKKEKERKKLEAKKNKKPVFKVCRVRSNDLMNENLHEVYNTIKGKKINKGKKEFASIHSGKSIPNSNDTKDLVKNEKVELCNNPVSNYHIGTAVETGENASMSTAGSVLQLSANQATDNSRTICKNDYTLTIHNINNSANGLENKSLRINLQRMNLEKMITSDKSSIQENGSKSSTEDLTETKIKKLSTPNCSYAKNITNCFVNLTPFGPDQTMMESTPLPHQSGKIKTRRSTRSSKKSPKNCLESLTTGFDKSSSREQDMQLNISTNKTRSIAKKQMHQQIDSPKNRTIISTSEEKFVPTNSVKGLRRSFKSPRCNICPGEHNMNSSRRLVALHKDPSDDELNEEYTPGPTASANMGSARLTRRSSRRILKDTSISEVATTSTEESGSNRRSRSKKSRTSIFNTPKAAWNLKLNDTYDEKTPKPEDTKKGKKTMSAKFFTPNQSLNDDVFKTPKMVDDEEVIAYISPFVTTARGKTAARKDYEMRKSLEGLNSSIAGTTDPRSPKAAAVYFERKLNREIVRIQELCEVWQNYKECGNVSEDACGLIDMTIGQSNLLISEKFKQFRGLIEKSKSNDPMEMRVQCEDLHGFWDMIFKQVQDLENRFHNLEDMKKNNWLEVAKKKTPKKKATKKKGRKVKSTTEASSCLKEAIKAAKKRNLKGASAWDMEVVIAQKNNSIPDRSILADGLNLEKNISTPARGILKSATAKSEKRKNVGFVEARSTVESSPIFIRRDTPCPRRSARISLGRSKLEFD